MNADFIRIAHRKAVWTKLQQLLLDQFVASDGPPKETIICEEVPYASKDVTNEALLEVLELIQQHEVDEQLEMRQFEFKRRRTKDAQQSGSDGNSNDGSGAEQQPASGGGQPAPAPSEGQAQGNAPAAPVGESPSAPASGGDREPAPSTG